MTGIYKITNLVNGKIYIGKSLNIKARFAAHRSYYKTHAPSRDIHYYHNRLYTAMRQYGLENFSFEVIEECPSEKLNEREVYWIEYYDSYNNGYNMTLGGDGGSPHETNARALLTLDDVIEIRKSYASHIHLSEAYKPYNNKISKRGFINVWTGVTWADVMPEVFSEENRRYHATKARGQKRPHNRALTDEEIYSAWQAKAKGESCRQYYEKHIRNKMSYSGFEKVWRDKNNYRDVREKYGLI